MGEELKFGTLGDTNCKMVMYDEEARAMAVLRMMKDETMSELGRALNKFMPDSDPALILLLTNFNSTAATVIERRVAQLGVDSVEFEEKVRRYQQTFSSAIKQN